jgi:hypothetical protein
MACIHDSILQGVWCEQAQFDFDGRDGMHSMSSANSLCADLAQADAPDLPLLNQCRQCFD